jgi:hypothetical protein
MITKLHFSSTPAGGSLIMPSKADNAAGVARVLASAEALNRAVEQTVSRSDDFGERLKEAVQAKLRQRHAARRNTPTAEEESFGQKLKRAIQRKANSPAKHKERAERERNRYPQPRQRTKGE